MEIDPSMFYGRNKNNRKVQCIIRNILLNSKDSELEANYGDVQKQIVKNGT